MGDTVNPKTDPHVRAWIWHCDLACDCSEPRIAITIPPPAWNDWYWLFFPLWEGAWLGGWDAEQYDRQRRGLRDAARFFGLPYDGDVEDEVFPVPPAFASLAMAIDEGRDERFLRDRFEELRAACGQPPILP